MATNNFKPFATGTGANVLSQTDYEALAALVTGFSSGKASSAQVNKAIRQATFIAAALAQYVTNKSGQDVLDDGNVSTFITKMATAFGKDFQALDAGLTSLAALVGGANMLPYYTAADVFAQTSLTAIGRSLIGQTTQANALSYLGGAPLASPALTGTPTAPTAAAGTNTTQIATTTFVQSAMATAIIWRGALPAAANLNNYGPTADSIGAWSRSSNTNTTAAYNFPEDSGQGVLDILPGGYFGCTQKYASRTGNIYIRSLSGSWNGTDGPWGDWALVGVQPRPAFFSGDLNTLTTPGSWSVTTPFTNGPTTVAGICEVLTRLNGTGVIQRYTAIATSADNMNRTWQRTLSGTTWSDWDSIATRSYAAPIASPTFTGTPTGPTAVAGNSTTQLATTAFVTTADNLKAPLDSPALTGTPTAPTAATTTNTTQIATTAFVKTITNLLATIASPTFTGTPSAPTAAAGTSTTQLATTAFIQAAITSLSLGTASSRNVGTGTNQIPDINSFTYSTDGSGSFVILLPGGIVIQSANFITDSTGYKLVTMGVALSDYQALVCEGQSGGWLSSSGIYSFLTSYGCNKISSTQFSVRSASWRSSDKNFITQSTVGTWLAIGRI